MEAQTYNLIMTDRDKRALDFLLAADFTPVNGYSYGELLDFLKQFKYFYRMIYDDKREMSRTNQHYVKQLELLDKRVDELEIILEKRNIQVKNLKEELIRKLTWRERLTGKIILNL